MEEQKSHITEAKRIAAEIEATEKHLEELRHEVNSQR
jgi:hypothetical protein